MRKLFSFGKGKGNRSHTAPVGAKGARAYAIGDVHGRLDLLESLLASIAADNAARPPAKTWLVMLGDIIDRGPNSKGIIELLLDRPPDFAKCVFLMGNHEEMLLKALSGSPEILTDWLQYGGMEFAQSYGIGPERLAGHSAHFVESELKHAVPQRHIDFLASFHDSFRFGDYLFVHAGIRPGIALEEQDERDLRWIRDGFLESEVDHGMVVVHGHTIVDAPDECENRIGIDAGAYRTGKLIALAVEGTERWYLSREGEPVTGESRWARG